MNFDFGPHMLRVPESYDPEKDLAEYFPNLSKARYFRYHSAANWIMADILKRIGKNFMDGVPLGREALDKALGQTVAGRTLKAMTNAKHVYIARKHFAGVYNRRYRPAKRLVKEPRKEILCAPWITKRRDKGREERYQKRAEPMHRPWRMWYDKLSVDMDLLKSYGGKLSSEGVAQCVQINSGKAYFVIDRCGGLHTIFTNLKREFRQFLRLDGHFLCTVDIVNCQPGLLAALVAQEGHTSEKDNLDKYVEVVSTGTLYELLCNETGNSRAFVKSELYKQVIARYGICELNNVRDVFRGWFPGVYAFIERYNKENRSYKALVLRLLRMQNELVLGRAGGICYDNWLAHRDCYLNLHDAICCGIAVGHRAKAALRSAMASMDVSLPVRLTLASEDAEKNDWTSAPALDGLDCAEETLKKTA